MLAHPIQSYTIQICLRPGNILIVSLLLVSILLRLEATLLKIMYMFL